MTETDWATTKKKKKKNSKKKKCINNFSFSLDFVEYSFISKFYNLIN